jgi:NADPH-dependent FMN reductase
MTDLLVVSVIGNPRPGSRTHRLAQVLGDEIATALNGAGRASVDLASLSPGVLDPDDAQARAGVDQVLRADVLVLASPTYKATYSGLLKVFLDRIGTGALAGTAACRCCSVGRPIISSPSMCTSRRCCSSLEPPCRHGACSCSSRNSKRLRTRRGHGLETTPWHWVALPDAEIRKSPIPFVDFIVHDP